MEKQLNVHDRDREVKCISDIAFRVSNTLAQLKERKVLSSQ